MTDARSRRLRAYRLGFRGEALASLALMMKGYRIVARRHRPNLAELHLLARRGPVVRSVELKPRRTLAEAMDAVGREAAWRIEGAADMWLSRQRDHSRLSLRFDLVAILPWRWPVHVENVFSGRS